MYHVYIDLRSDYGSDSEATLTSMKCLSQLLWSQQNNKSEIGGGEYIYLAFYNSHKFKP